MQSSDYLEKMLGILSGSFDIYRPVAINAKEYPAYGYFFSLSEKFLVTQKVNLWSARMYEHIVFMQVDKCTEATLAEARDLIENHLEYMYVRKGEKYPEKDRMYYFGDLSFCKCNQFRQKLPFQQELPLHRKRQNRRAYHLRGLERGNRLRQPFSQAGVQYI